MDKTRSTLPAQQRASKEYSSQEGIPHGIHAILIDHGPGVTDQGIPAQLY
jgi:hypothetical protein